MFVFSNHQAPGPGLFAAYSINGGESWVWVDDSDGIIADGDPGDPLPDANADPSASWDEFGNLFITYVIENSEPFIQEIHVAISTNGGKDFAPLETLGGFADQPTIVTGPGLGGTSSVWVSYKEFSGPFDPMVARGAKVNGIGDVDPFEPALEIPSTILCSRDDIAIGPDGQVIVVCQEGDADTQGTTNILMSLNTNGLTGPFDSPKLIRTTEVGMDDVIPAQPTRGLDAAVGVVYDRSDGDYHGRLYLVYTDEDIPEFDDTDIYVIYSENNGSTWSHDLPPDYSPTLVNNDVSDRSQFWPRIALDQTSGHVAVSWHDCRNDIGAPIGAEIPGNRKDAGDTAHNDDTQFYASMSVDGGDSFPRNVLVSKGTSDERPSHGDFDLDYGDYTGLAFDHGYFFPAWADNSDCAGATDCNGVIGTDGDNPDDETTFDIYTAKVVPEPGQLLALSSGIMALWGLSFLRVRDRVLGRRLG